MKEARSALLETMFIVALFATLAFAMWVLRHNNRPVVQEQQPKIDTMQIKIQDQQIVVDCYFDSCSFCSESKLKYYGDMLDIETLKLRELENGKY